MIIGYSDLDDSLFNTAAKCQHSLDECMLGAVDNDGQPLSYCSPKQKALIDLVSNNGVLIPVTARSIRAFNNVTLKFDSYMIINNGATILDKDKQPNAEWEEAIRAEAESYAPILSSLAQCLEELFNSLNIVPSINRPVMFGDTICYHTVKVDQEHVEQMTQLSKSIQGIIDITPGLSGLKVGVNGRSLMVYPPYASKRRAIEFVNKLLNVTDNDLLIGIGDSLSDLDFMRSCDFMMIPQHSQIKTNKLEK